MKPPWASTSSYAHRQSHAAGIHRRNCLDAEAQPEPTPGSGTSCFRRTTSVSTGLELAMDVSDASGTSVSTAAGGPGRRHPRGPDFPGGGEVAESAEVDALNRDGEDMGLPGAPPRRRRGRPAASAVEPASSVKAWCRRPSAPGVVFASSDTWRTTPDGSLHAFCHAVPDTWHLMGVMPSAAGSLDWFRPVRGFRRGRARPRRRSVRHALRTRRGRRRLQGLYFPPYLTGERTPHPDPNARGCFIGLTLATAEPR